jgi:YHS domain-containing protein
MKKQNSFFAVLVVVLGFVPFNAALAAEAQGPYRSDFFGTAVEGYDVVAYFSQSKPVKGERKYSTEWQDVTWRFSSQENLSAFKAAPAKFAPQYGGQCAYAVSQGYPASIDPVAWSIVDDKLYLNFSLGVRSTWEKDIPGYISDANKNWPKVREGL